MNDRDHRAHWHAKAAVYLFARAHGQSFQKDQKREVQNVKPERDLKMKGTNDEAMQLG